MPLPRTCIVTDSTVIFTKPIYPGMEHVQIIPHASSATPAPSVETFRQVFSTLGSNYHEIIAILSTSSLSPAFENAQRAISDLRMPLNLQIIDSQTTAVGLGLLVQSAAEAIQRGVPISETCSLLRGMLRNIYAIFCLPDLTSLYQTGQLDQAQAIVGELLGIVPVFIMENGKLIYVHKVRNPRHLIDILFEFVLEFESLKFLALLKGDPFFTQECLLLRERINQNIRMPHLCEYGINTAIANLLGPRTIGLVSLQTPNKEAA